MGNRVDGELKIPNTSNPSNSDRGPTSYRLSFAGCKGQGKRIMDYFCKGNVKEN